jgi:hypothetical protein
MNNAHKPNAARSQIIRSSSKEAKPEAEIIFKCLPDTIDPPRTKKE